ncbi:pig-x domain containing protein [Stylonychia lemnae]|uniref:Pig-x domain containing protein n=1 Tax=Stylonychia lemnae TaxID=5949 RepID=A0A078AXC1_STYLE|nr:pig-x domain containing protein [Stylonychia lemnae]|eukprot:CDW87110.1 pig-x domain containing protein [Stylonychia lemnae]
MFFDIQKVIDIEKPASVSQEHEFVWRLPLQFDTKIHSSYVKNFEKRLDIEASVGHHYEINFPFHYRYQPIKSKQNHTQVVWTQPEVFFDCKKRNLSEYMINGKRHKVLPDLIEDGMASANFKESIPNGKLEDRELNTQMTLAVSFVGFLLLLKNLYSKSKQNIL